VARNPYLHAFDLRSGEIVELTVDAAVLVYLMMHENLTKYRVGRDDYAAEGQFRESVPSSWWREGLAVGI
jgi:hypothetical protein